MPCRKVFVALDHSLRTLRVGEVVVVADDDKAPLDMWNFLRKYRPMRFRIRREGGNYWIKRRLDFD